MGDGLLLASLCGRHTDLHREASNAGRAAFFPPGFCAVGSRSGATRREETHRGKRWVLEIRQIVGRFVLRLPGDVVVFQHLTDGLSEFGQAGIDA